LLTFTYIICVRDPTSIRDKVISGCKPHFTNQFWEVEFGLKFTSEMCWPIVPSAIELLLDHPQISRHTLKIFY